MSRYDLAPNEDVDPFDRNWERASINYGQYRHWLISGVVPDPAFER